MSLQPLGAVAPTELVQARNALHYAVQLIASAGHYLAKPQPDDGHRSLTWEPELSAFRGVDLEGGFFVRVKAVEFTAEIVKLDQTVITELELDDSPLPESLLLLQAQMPVPEARRSFSFAKMDAAFPDAATLERTLYAAPLEQREELALHYAHADEALQALVADEPKASPVRVWPHHFDIATLLPGPGPDSTIGVGLSPGDAGYAEPYWYVTPHDPTPNATESTPPKPWSWHTEGWMGLVLPMSRLFKHAKEASRDGELRASLGHCVEIARKVSG
ncbi:MAG TPA: hypothetical protein VKT78_14835 [Fimbriimonadaceae bacterium]|nr:hypothetical protein [Fimbriimonadaceae bacterium]